MYQYGKGVPQNYRAALKWYRAGAELGNAPSMYSLGIMYKSGQGVPQDDQASAKWYRAAAEQGFAAAQSRLGFMYMIGEGVPRDMVNGYAWSSVAASNGNGDGEDQMKQAEGFMTPSQLAEGQDLAMKLWDQQAGSQWN